MHDFLKMMSEVPKGLTIFLKWWEGIKYFVSCLSKTNYNPFPFIPFLLDNMNPTKIDVNCGFRKLLLFNFQQKKDNSYLNKLIYEKQEKKLLICWKYPFTTLNRKYHKNCSI